MVAEAATGDEALTAVCQHRPDLLVLDLSMPGLPPDQLIPQARASVPDLKVLILSAYGDDAHVRRLSQLSLSGYLLKDEAVQHLVQAVRVIAQGAVWFSQSVADKLRGLPQLRGSRSDILELSERELEVLHRISSGLDNKEIAAQLNLAEQTVRNYASRLYQKIGVGSRAEAVVWAYEHGLEG